MSNNYSRYKSTANLTLLIFIYLAIFYSGNAQHVDPFTGDFSYSIPLMTVPSPNGPGIPISANYSAGITVEQQASAIGLGWSYSAGGAINRGVNEIPDDWNGKTADDEEGDPQTWYGSLFFKNCTTGCEYFDTYTSKYKLPDTLEFIFPAYDNYQVNAPGLGGRIEPHLFDFATLPSSNLLDPGETNPGSGFSKTPQFRFAVELSGNLQSRHYPGTISSSSTFYYPEDEVSGSAQDYEGLGYDQTSNRLSGTKYIEYTTDATGIDAFKITDESGMVYHFDLPVYAEYQKSVSYELKHDYKVKDPVNYKDSVMKDPKYATSWKLTAITGPDYIDANSSGQVDIGDKGYWVKFEYKAWTLTYKVRTPYYGINYAFNVPEDRNPDDDIQAYNGANTSGKEGVINTIEEDIYYLNKIQTSSHTALFIRDIRLDAHSKKESGYAKPLLKLNKIILLSNENITALPNLDSNITTSVSGFSLSGCYTGNFYNQQWYNGHQSAIDSLSLKTVDFTTDYSLARKFYNNINTTVSTTLDTTSQKMIRDNISTSAYTSSGKLTLNKMQFYEQGKVSVTPSYQFDYNYASSTDNPDYNPMAVDYWGYYKSDITAVAYSSYRTSGSGNYVDAWSLRKIIQPMGDTIEVNYESDKYKQVFGEDGTMRGSVRTFHILDALNMDSVYGKTWEITMEDPNATEGFLYSGWSSYSKHVSLPFSCCNWWNTPDNDGDEDQYLAYGDFDFEYTCAVSGAGGCLSWVFTGNIENIDTIVCNKDCSGYLEEALTTQYPYSGNGYISYQLPTTTEVYGGDIRVTNIVIKDETGQAAKTIYTYSDGVATAEPDRFALPKTYYSPAYEANAYLKLHQQRIDQHQLGPMIGYSTVEVKSVDQEGNSEGKIQYTFENSPTSATNANVFNVLDTGITCNWGGSNCVEYCEGDFLLTCNPDGYGGYYCLGCGDGLFVKRIILQSTNYNSAIYGNVISTKHFDMNNNIILTSSNTYVQTEIGKTREVFRINKSYTLGGGQHDPLIGYGNNIIIIKDQYQSIPTQQTTTKDGLTYTTEYLAFDSLTGMPTKVKTTDPINGITITEATPAFRLTPYANMGLKSINSSYTNNPMAVAETRIYKDAHLTTNNDFLGHSVNTFTQTCKKRAFNTSTGKFENADSTLPYWMGKKSYNWTGPLGVYGLYDSTEYTAFDHSGTNSSYWRSNSSVTLYDNRQHAIETKSLTNRFSANRYSANGYYAIASASDCNYASFVYSGFEDTIHYSTYKIFDGELTKGEYISQAVTAHTGNYTAAVPSGNEGPSYTVLVNTDTNGVPYGLHTGRTYRASVWVHKNSPYEAKLVINLNGNSGGGSINQTVSMAKNDAKAIPAGDWYQLNVDINVPADFNTISGTGLKVYVDNSSGGSTAYFDDLMLHPFDASFSATVYDRVTGRVMSNINNYNFADKYEYDAAGRLLKAFTEVKDKGFTLVQEKLYNFAREGE